MELYFWIVFSMFAGAFCGLALGYVIWGLENPQDDRDIPTGDDW